MRLFESKQSRDLKKQRKEIDEIKNHRLYQIALKKHLAEFSKLNKKNQEIFDKSLYCPHISGAVGHKYSHGFGDYYCFKGVSVQIWKDTMSRYVRFEDCKGNGKTKEMSSDIRESAGERFCSKIKSLKPCMYWNAEEEDCMLLRSTDPE